MATEQLIRVHRNEKDVGYFTPEMAIECLRSGVLRPDDWAYCDGLLDWTPLVELVGFAESVAKPASVVLPPPLPSPPVLAAVPPAISAWAQRPKRKTPIAVFVVSGAVVCLLGSLFLAAIVGSSPPSIPSDSRGERDAGLLPPLKNFDVNAEPIEAVPALGMSREDVANFREWMAAGSPRYWKGKDQFPGMSQEQWEQWRKSTRQSLDRQ